MPANLKQIQEHFSGTACALSCAPADRAVKGYDLDVSANPGGVVSAAEYLGGIGFALDTITGVDWIAQNEMEVVYDYFHPASSLRIVVRTRVPRDNP